MFGADDDDSQEQVGHRNEQTVRHHHLPLLGWVYELI